MSAGPITIPPPIPNIPASTPAARPMAIKRVTFFSSRMRVLKSTAQERSGWNSFLDRLQPLVGKDVYLLERRVHVGRDSNSLELRMHDRSVYDPVLIEEPRAELDVVDSLDLEERDGSGLPVVER